MTDPKRGKGRPSSYKSDYASQARKLCDLGATDEDLADFFGVNVRTVIRWKTQYEDFCQALKDGKGGADDRVERSLFQRAVGYSHDAVKILTVSQGQNKGSVVQQVPYVEHHPPDTTAAIFWLKNRRPDLWREKVAHEHSGPDGAPIQTQVTSARVLLAGKLARLTGPEGSASGSSEPN